ncbi:MAG TPA: ROK family transcriptional regulator [Bryobacteraceae bacterium]|nr:ROK family transcriptional regulator [Bryobacteraceae bacterium]
MVSLKAKMTINTLHRVRMQSVEDLRETNELKLLHIIRDRQPISRADLVKETGLLAGTVSVIVNRLLRAAIVNEGEAAPSSGGRPATYLQVNAEKAHAIGINIGVEQTLYGLSDFNGRILNQRTISTGDNAEKFLTALADDIHGFLEADFRGGKLAAAGVSLPGLIDRVDGCLVRAPNLSWQNVAVKSILERQLKLPVYVENDANAAALAELWYGPIEVWSAHCILFLLVVEGVGSGLILNGEVYTGSRIGMGGFGHVSVDPNGLPCSCGNIGCWETVASDQATLKRYTESTKQEPKVNSLSELIATARKGNEQARQELLKTASFIGRGIRGLAQGLAPDIVVIGGKIADAWPMIEPAINNELKSQYLVEGISLPRVRPASVEQPSFYGAFPVALSSVMATRRKAS